MSKLPLLALMFAASAMAQTSVNGVPNQTVAGISAPNSLGVSLINFGNATVAQLSTLATTNSILGIGTVLVVSDASTAGDVTIGGGTVHELVQCTSMSSTHCGAWTVLAGGGSSGGGGTSDLLGEWFLNEGSTPSVDHAAGDLSPMSTITASWTTQAGLTGALSFIGDSTSYAVGNSNTKLQFNYTTPFSWWGWVNLTTPSGAGNVNPRFIDNINTTGADIGWSFGANYNATFITGCTSTTYCPMMELLGAGGYPSNSYDAFCQHGVDVGGLHFIAITYDGLHTSTSTTCYIDNVAYPGQTIATSLNSTIISTDYIAIGNESGKADSNTLGILGTQGIIGRVLTTGDVATLWGNPYAIIN